MTQQYIFTKRFKELMVEHLIEKLGPDFYLKQEYDLGLSEIKSPVDLWIKGWEGIYLIEYEDEQAPL